MRGIWALVLVGGCVGGGPDPVRWLDFYGYQLAGLGLQEVPQPTVGPGLCPSGNRAFRAEAARKPTPEDNPCMLVRAKVVICCPYSARRCYGREVSISCEQGELPTPR